jgi:hypothetical protein
VSECESVGQRGGVGKATDDEPMFCKLIGKGLAIVRVVLDVEDSDELPRFGQGLVCSSPPGVCRFNIIVRCCVSISC